MEAQALAIPRALKRDRIAERTVRIASPWTIAAIVAGFYTLITVPGLAWNPYQFVNIGHQYYEKGTSSTSKMPLLSESCQPIVAIV